MTNYYNNFHEKHNTYLAVSQLLLLTTNYYVALLMNEDVIQGQQIVFVRLIDQCLCTIVAIFICFNSYEVIIR